MELSPVPRSSSLFTAEDFKASFALFCTVCGIGTLGMPANYARAGPVVATIALLIMASANVYATVTLSRVMLMAPKTVKSYSDLGEWVMGRPGRYVVLFSQMAVCLLVPCAFLILGSLMFQVLFPGTFTQVFWIIFMALIVFPVALIPTMREGAGMMFAGCLGTIIADIIGIAVLIHNMRGHPSIPAPEFDIGQVATTFGNLSLAYGAAIVIPDLQRGHKEPHRMPRVVFITMTVVSCFFLAVAILGYTSGGCQLSGNLLFSIAGGDGGKTTLGFVANRGAVVMAYLFMQLHIVIAFSALLHPAFFITERLVLGMHKEKVVFVDRLEKQYQSAITPARESDTAEGSDDADVSVFPMIEEEAEVADELAEYRGSGNTLRYVLLRSVLIVLLVIASVALKDKFLDLVDFIGASAISMSCLIIPLTFYLKLCWRKIHILERCIAILLILMCTVCGTYVMIETGKTLFGHAATPPGVIFPFCPAEHQKEPFYVRNA